MAEPPADILAQAIPACDMEEMRKRAEADKMAYARAYERRENRLHALKLATDRHQSLDEQLKAARAYEAYLSGEEHISDG